MATTLELSGLVEVEETVSCQLSARDHWGSCAASELRSFAVVATPEPPLPEGPGACANGRRRYSAQALWLPLLALMVRRRSVPPRRRPRPLASP